MNRLEIFVPPPRLLATQFPWPKANPQHITHLQRRPSGRLSSLNDNSQHEGGGNENNLDRRDVVAENVGDGQKGDDAVDDGSSATHEANADSSDGGLGMAPSAVPSAASNSSSDWEEVRSHCNKWTRLLSDQTAFPRKLFFLLERLVR